MGAVIVTGGSSGIGETLIKLIGTLDQRIFFCNLSRTSPRDNLLPGRVSHICTDLSERKQLESSAQEAIRWVRERVSTGKVLLVNNSGFGSYGPFDACSLAGQVDMVSVNASAPVHLTALLLPLLKERGGWIVNIASTAAFQPTPYMATYGATKAFLLHWSLALDAELRGSGVRALAVCPGPTESNFFRRAGFEQAPLPKGFGQTSEQVAWTTLRALDRGKSLVVSGWSNKVLTAFSSFLPKTLVTRLSAWVLGVVRLRVLKQQQARKARGPVA